MVAVVLRSRRDGCDGAGHDRDVVVGAAVRCCLHGRSVETTENIVVIAFVAFAIILILVLILLLFLVLFSSLLVVRQSADGSEGIDEKGQGEDLGEDGRHDGCLDLRMR